MIIGHILQGKVADNYARFIIYSFHMPLFIGIAGYLISGGSSFSLSPNSFVLRFLKRPVWPWFIAMMAYCLLPNLTNFSSVSGMMKTLLICFVFPYHHLWFIPAYLVWVSGIVLFKWLKFSWSSMLFVSLSISFLFYPVDHHLIFLEWMPFGQSILFYMGKTFHLQFFFFFTLGFIGFKGLEKLSLRMNIVILLLLFWAYSFAFYNEVWILAAPVYFVFNAWFIFIFFQLIGSKKMPDYVALSIIGRNSLPIYLWHIFPILLAHSISQRIIDYRFYFLAVVFEILLIISVSFLSKNRMIDKYLFGKF